MDTHELLTQKKALIDEARAIQTRVMGEQNGEWRGDDTAKFDALTDKAEAISATAERIAKLDHAEREIAESEAPTGRRSEPTQPSRYSGSRQVTDRDRGEALRAWMIGGAPEVELTQEQLAHAQRCGINPNSKRVTFRLSSNGLKPTAHDANGLRVCEDDLRTWNTRLTEERAALTGLQSTTTTGGYTVPDETMRELEVALLAFGGMRSVSTVLRTATGGPLPIPTTNDTANKGEIIGENTTSNELEMTFGQLVLDAWKYSSKYILASIEFLQDTSINAPAFLGAALGDRIARITNDHFTTGTGSQPNGIVTAATSSAITTAAQATITYDNLVDVEHTIDPAYRTRGRWMMHDTALKIIKKIKVLQYSGDTSGTPLWVPGLASGAPDTILGYPYTINQSMATIGSGSKSVLFGDLSKYQIRDVRDVTVVRLDELFALLGQVAFLALSRHDGDLLNAGTNPVKYMIQGS